MRRAVHLALAACACGMLAGAHAEPVGPGPGHERMVAVLAEIVRRAPDSEHPMVGSRLLREFRRQAGNDDGPLRDRIERSKYLENSLLRNDGRGGFRDVTREQRLDRVTLPMGANFGDLDNDGYPEVYLGTGYPGLEGLVPNVLYHNERGRGFRDVSVVAGVAHLQKGHGVVFADLDNDGDQDIYHQIGGFWPSDSFVNALFENPGFGRHWITVELRGKQGNRFGVGARIRVDFDDGGRPRSVYRIVGSGGSFGANPMRQEIGVGDGSRVERVEVTWPASGLVQSFRDLPTNGFVRLTEGVDRAEVLERRTFRFRRP